MNEIMKTIIKSSQRISREIQRNVHETFFYELETKYLKRKPLNLNTFIY